jgi:hypothetical protein
MECRAPARPLQTLHGPGPFTGILSLETGNPPFSHQTSSVSAIRRYLKDLLKGGLFAGTADSIFNPTCFIKGIVPKNFSRFFPIFLRALIVTS